ncbi:pyridoxal kinase-like [Panonychus citri]|uniref:pyridoxal kinase-like n=1 Tax=Panonychus citri TaxID=50023 RepID=UPI002307CFDE|nr:pyridoxal kinase-like [Panonychus citri]
MDSPRVLSIQSHVVHGYVGNKSATFPLQILGFEVDTINSVQYSNHVHYKVTKGQEVLGSDLHDLFQGISGNDLIQQYTHLLTGYCRSASFLSELVGIVTEMKKLNPNIKYVCDPVMGDNGKFYVSDDQVKIYREQLLPLADIITPNQFEAEVLTGIKIESTDDIIKAIDILHSRGVSCVCITSTEIGDEARLPCFASRLNGNEKERFSLMIPKIDARFVGTGDLFAALLLAWLHKSNYDLKGSLENTVSTMQTILNRTFNYAKSIGKFDDDSLELKLIQSKIDIETPTITINATSIPG